MDSEKDFFKRDLSQAETESDIDKIIEDAELMGHKDIVALATERREALLAKTKAVETTPPAVLAEAENMGGSVDEVAKTTEDIDAQIDAVKAETEAKVAEVQGEALPAVETPPIPPSPEKPKEVSEKSAEQLELEKLKSELQEKNDALREVYEQVEIINKKIEEIKNQKGYSKELETAESKQIPSEQILAAVLPNKKIGLENLRKILLSPTYQYDKDSIQELIDKINSISEEDVKNMSQNLSYAWAGISPSRLTRGSLEYTNELGKITGSQEVENVVRNYRETSNKVLSAREKIKEDSEIVEAEKQRAVLLEQTNNNHADTIAAEVVRVKNQIQKLQEKTAA